MKQLIKKLHHKIVDLILDRYGLSLRSDYEKKVEEEIKTLLAAIRGKGLHNLVWELYFSEDIIDPLSRKETYRIYAKMGIDPEITKLFKSRYSRCYIAYIKAKDDLERNLLKGRMLELEMAIRIMGEAHDRLQNWEEIEKVEAKKIKMRDTLHQEIIITK